MHDITQLPTDPPWAVRARPPPPERKEPQTSAAPRGPYGQPHKWNLEAYSRVLRGSSPPDLHPLYQGAGGHRSPFGGHLRVRGQKLGQPEAGKGQPAHPRARTPPPGACSGHAHSQTQPWGAQLLCARALGSSRPAPPPACFPPAAASLRCVRRPARLWSCPAARAGAPAPRPPLPQCRSAARCVAPRRQ